MCYNRHVCSVRPSNLGQHLDMVFQVLPIGQMVNLPFISSAQLTKLSINVLDLVQAQAEKYKLQGQQKHRQTRGVGKLKCRVARKQKLNTSWGIQLGSDFHILGPHVKWRNVSQMILFLTRFSTYISYVTCAAFFIWQDLQYNARCIYLEVNPRKKGSQWNLLLVECA